MPRPLPAHVAEATGGDAGSVRDHILDAAYRVVANRGLAAASTRAVATEAGIASGTLYNYFANRYVLLAHTILRRAVLAAERSVAEPAALPGEGTVAGNLRLFAARAGELLDEMVPLFAAAFSDNELLAALHVELHAGATEIDPTQAIVQYLLAEQALGRVDAGADCRAAAAIVIGLFHDRAFHRFLAGAQAPSPSLDPELDFVATALTRR